MKTATFDLNNLTRTDYLKMFEGMKSKNCGTSEYKFCEVICNYSDDETAKGMMALKPYWAQDWLERGERLNTENKWGWKPTVTISN